MLIIVALSSYVPLDNKRLNHIKNVHKNLHKVIQNDVKYIGDNCYEEHTHECIVRWERVHSMSKSAIDLNKKIIHISKH